MFPWKFFDNSKDITVLFDLKECEVCQIDCTQGKVVATALQEDTLWDIGLYPYQIPSQRIEWDEETKTFLCPQCKKNLN